MSVQTSEAASPGVFSLAARFGRLGPWLAAGLVLLFLIVFLVLPVGLVLRAAFVDEVGNLTLAHFLGFFGQSLLRESFVNSLIVAAGSVVLASLIALPLAYMSVRYEFRGGMLIQVLGVLPLMMPPFVGAVAMQLMFGTNGSLNLLLGQAFGINIPFMQGLSGLVFVESVHYFPFVLLSVVASLKNVDRDMEEAALNLGARGWRLFRRVVLPLAMPGYVAGAGLVFVKVFDDLGTPLVLGVTNLLAPQAYLRITSLGVEDPLGYVIGVIMIVFSVFALRLSLHVTAGKEYATLKSGGVGLHRRRLGPFESVLAYGALAAVLFIVLAPHLAILLMSFAKVWSFSVLPEGFTWAHYATVFQYSGGMVGNTLMYCSLAAGLDVVVGTTIAYLVLRTDLPGRHWLDYIASAALAVPGLVLAIGYLRLFRGVNLPFTDVPVVSAWVILVVVYAVRRLPYVLRYCMVALQQVHVSLEEAAESLGAGRLKTMGRIVIPLMMGGMLAGFMTSFVTAAVELSATLVLTARESDAPMSYGFYLYMQSASGRGPGAALGVIAIAMVALGTYLSHRIANRVRALPQADQ